MTSIVRNFAQRKEGLTRFVKPESPCYNDTTIGSGRLFPFSYSNEVLDITYAGNDFQAVMVDVPNQAPLDETDTAVQIMSGPYLATSLGNNFKDYIRSWRSSTIDAGSPIEIYIAPQLLRVQQADTNNITANNGDSYLISTEAPASDNYIAGSQLSDYSTTYVFKTPLTFTIVESGVVKYITFRTMLDQE
jgi:hypothetical protein